MKKDSFAALGCGIYKSCMIFIVSCVVHCKILMNGCCVTLYTGKLELL